jgi:dTDP-4-dehydrorhamnose reductase
MTRILITGASGYLGYTLTGILSRTDDVWAGYWSSPFDGLGGTPLRFDVTDEDDVRHAFETSRPQCVIHAAALTKPDICEIKPAEAHTLNVEATRRIARYCREFGAKLIHISTDLVFDGRKGMYNEDDLPVGIHEYARSKILAEKAIRSEGPHSAVILRVSVLYGPGGGPHGGFLDDVLGRWRKGEPMTFFTDQYRSPTFTPQIAEAVRAFIAQPQVSGLFHLGGDRLSRYEFGVLLAEIAGVPASLVRAGSLHDYRGAKRGADCSLVSGKIRRVLGVEPMTCSDGLRELKTSL